MSVPIRGNSKTKAHIPTLDRSEQTLQEALEGAAQMDGHGPEEQELMRLRWHGQCNVQGLVHPGNGMAFTWR